jgi:hypothetical protein
MREKELRQDYALASQCGIVLMNHITRFADKRSNIPPYQLDTEQLALKKRYFCLQACEYLARFFELSPSKAYSIDEILAHAYRDTDKKRIQKILLDFIEARYDAIKTVQKLSLYLAATKPLCWQFKRRSRYQYLVQFIEKQKRVCLQEILKNQQGFSGAIEVNTLENRYSLSHKYAANHTYFSDTTPQEMEQKRSLFLLKEKSMIRPSKRLSEEIQQVQSFFKHTPRI